MRGRRTLSGILLGAVLVVAAAHAETAARPDFSGRWVLDEKASTLPPRMGGDPGRGGGPPPSGAPGREGRAGGPPPGGGPPREGGPRGTPREFTLEQTADQMLLRDGERLFRVLLLTREKVVKVKAAAGTQQSEAHWEGDALVIDDLTRGGAARKQTWRIESGDAPRLVIVTRIAAEGERPAIESKQVFTRSGG